MKADISKAFLPVYEALASEVRLNVLRLIAQKPMHNKELAETLGLSAAIMTMHVGKLEKSGLIHCKMERRNGATYKFCYPAANHIHIEFPQVQAVVREKYEITIPVGHFTDYNVFPTCGLATQEKIIGHYDDPRYFMSPERMNAEIMWIGKGFVEYKFPNYLLAGQQLEEIEISMEIGSEAPGVNESWPSDISFYLNGMALGEWTSPGDFGHSRGRLTPAWWNDNVNQYGMLKVIRINEEGTFLDGGKMSAATMEDVQASGSFWTLRLEVAEDAAHVGGLTLFGKAFGNYEQDIVIRVYYKEEQGTS
jgi:predicted transcriptional regulator